jgi:SAM-dependent methyltransferase
MSEHSAVSQAAFESKYRLSGDPWNFAHSEYEQDRYQLTLRSLMRRRYRRAFEPGCSVGVFTAALASRCDEVVATDIAPSAVAMAGQRCARLPQVAISCADIATQRPSGRFDLIVFSELGYYFSGSQLRAIVQALGAQLEHGGELIGVHWLGDSEDHLLHGDQVHDTLHESLAHNCTWIKGVRYAKFRLDSWRRE